MAITKIHPIKSTLNFAISYIVNGEKTDEQILVSTHKCHQENCSHTIFKNKKWCRNKRNCSCKASNSILFTGRSNSWMAHQIGMELCKKILKDEYEFVLSTHIDKGHIHNHIIFNNVNMVTGRCYQSNKKSWPPNPLSEW